jgi:hypothetical protein
METPPETNNPEEIEKLIIDLISYFYWKKSGIRGTHVAVGTVIGLFASMLDGNVPQHIAAGFSSGVLIKDLVDEPRNNMGLALAGGLTGAAAASGVGNFENSDGLTWKQALSGALTGSLTGLACGNLTRLLAATEFYNLNPHAKGRMVANIRKKKKGKVAQ